MTELTPIRARLFPSRVQMPDGKVLDPVLTLIGLDRVWFYEQGDRLLGEYMLDDLWGSQQNGYGMVLDGREVSISRGANCGCGSPYKGGRNPFPIRIMMSPIPKRRSML